MAGGRTAGTLEHDSSFGLSDESLARVTEARGGGSPSPRKQRKEEKKAKRASNAYLDDTGLVRTAGPAAAELAKQLEALQAQSEQWTGFSTQQLRTMAPFFEVRTLRYGNAVFHEGDRCDFCGIVLTGQLGVVVRGELLAMLPPGAVFGEMAMFHGGLRNAELRCVKKEGDGSGSGHAQVATMSYDALRHLLEEHEADVGAQLNGTLAHICVAKELDTERALSGMRTSSADSRASSAGGGTSAEDKMHADERTVRVAQLMEAQRQLHAHAHRRSHSGAASGAKRGVLRRMTSGGSGRRKGAASPAPQRRASFDRQRRGSFDRASSASGDDAASGARGAVGMHRQCTQGAAAASEAQARQLLQSLPTSASGGGSIARFWRVFTAEQLGRLATVLPVVRFRPHEVLLERGQQASFVAVVLSGVVDVLLPGNGAGDGAANGKGAGDAPPTTTCGPGEPLGEMPLFHSIFHSTPRTADAVGGAEAGWLAICSYHELAVLRSSQPELAELLLLLLARCCAWRMLQNTSLRSGSGARALRAFGAADEQWRERQLQPLVKDLLERERQQHWEKVDTRITRESAETLLLRVRYNEHTGFSGRSLPQIYGVAVRLPGGGAMPLRCLLGWTVHQVLARALDGWLAPLREAERLAHAAGRGPGPTARLHEASVAANAWMLCSPDGVPVYPLSATLSAIPFVNHYIRHQRMPPLVLRPRPSRRAHAQHAQQASVQTMIASGRLHKVIAEMSSHRNSSPRRKSRPATGASEAIRAHAQLHGSAPDVHDEAPPKCSVLGETLGWSEEAFEELAFRRAMRQFLRVAMAASPYHGGARGTAQLPTFGYAEEAIAARDVPRTLLAQVTIPGGRICTLPVPPAHTGQQLLQRALLELMRQRRARGEVSRARAGKSEKSEGGTGSGGSSSDRSSVSTLDDDACRTLRALEQQLTLRVAGSFDFVEGGMSLIRMRCTACCIAEGRPLQLCLVSRAASLAWLHQLPVPFAATTEGHDPEGHAGKYSETVQPQPQLQVLGDDQLPAHDTGQLVVGGVLLGKGKGAHEQMCASMPELLHDPMHDDRNDGEGEAAMLATGRRARWLPDGRLQLLDEEKPEEETEEVERVEAACVDGPYVLVSEVPLEQQLMVCVRSVESLHQFAQLFASGGKAESSGMVGDAALEAREPPWKLRVQLGVYLCGVPLAPPVTTRMCTATARTSATWDQWVQLLPLHVLPRSARLCVTLLGRPARASGDTPFQALGWVAFTLFDHTRQLRTGVISRKLWPNQAAQPEGCVCENGSVSQSDAALLVLRMPQMPASVYHPEARDDKAAPHDGGDAASRPTPSHASHSAGALIRLVRAVRWEAPAQRRNLRLLVQAWPLLPPLEAIELLGPRVAHDAVRACAVRSLMALSDGQLRPLVLQLTQALKHEPFHDAPLVRMILHRCARSPQLIGAGFFWALIGEPLSSASLGPQHKQRFGLLVEQVLAMCGGYAQQLRTQHALLRRFAAIAEQVNEVPGGPDRQSALQLQLAKLRLPPAFGLPLDPRLMLGGLQVESCKVMDSKKAPLFLVFKSVDQGSPSVPVLFKCGDDLRQDALVLQLLSLMDCMWRSDGLDLHMTLYRVVPTGDEQGLIGIVQGATTTSNITKAAGGAKAAFSARPLVDFLRKHNRSEAAFASARRVFLLSCAAYCVATYVLGIGDRHNSNVMLCRDGRLFHIDFGHFLGNYKSKFGIKRERAPFVFTPDFCEVLGGRNSPGFAEFQRVCGHAYNVVRARAVDFNRLLTMMLHSGMPELQNEEDIAWVNGALALDMTEAEAAAHFKKLIDISLNTKTTQINNMAHIIAHS